MADASLTPAATVTPRPRRTRTKTSRASLTLRGIAIVYVGLLVLLPVGVILYRTFEPGFGEFFDALSSPQATHAFTVTAIVALWAVGINVVFGITAAILLARYRFFGKRLLSALIDLPIAVSPIVVGLALVLVFGPTGWFGPYLNDHGVHVIAAKPGMIIATCFVSLPLVVRAIVPVLEQVGLEQEQAAASLGANGFARLRRITLPTIRTALTYGIVLSLARCIGEYGAVLVVSNNIEGQTETAPLRVGNLVENELNYNAAYAITFVLMSVAFAAILVAAWIRHRRNS